VNFNCSAVPYVSKFIPPWTGWFRAKATSYPKCSYLSFVLQAFSVIAMFNVMKFSIAILPFSVKAVAEARVSLRRMKV
jgi:hypothetical protein